MSLRLTLAAAALTATLSAPALANQCPTMASKIEAANANLSQAEMAQVEELLTEGMRLHEGGKHQESMETLARAQKAEDGGYRVAAGPARRSWLATLSLGRPNEERPRLA